MPGLIIQGLRKCQSNNAVFLLDEIDKLSRDYRGDPASALLEVLDPEQNNAFSDHYINIPIDLSGILFIATANESDTIPPGIFDGKVYLLALLDRMEIIRLPGYTFGEKSFIAKRYLIPKQLLAHSIDEIDTTFSDEAIDKIATGYTNESGVRGLEREIATICRTLAVSYAECVDAHCPETFNGIIDVTRVVQILGSESVEDEVSVRLGIPGIACGLATTSNGGGGLLFIEASQMKGKGALQLTGTLGDVIKESAQLALSYVRANATVLDIHTNFDTCDLHIHFPAGAIPKDGPSAGVAIVSALVSLLTQTCISDHTAMTGEISLRGHVLPVGGIKAKVFAAHRAGITRVILPLRNQKDIIGIPGNVSDSISFVFVSTLHELFSAIFSKTVRNEPAFAKL